MKTTLIWMIRHLLIPVGFVWTTGIFCIFEQNDKLQNPRIDGVGGFTAADIATLEITPQNALAYGDSLVKLRKSEISRTRLYAPYDYFHDLKQFEMFNQLYYDSLSKTLEGSDFLMTITSGMGFSFKGQLVNLRAENWRNLNLSFRGSGLSGLTGNMNISDAQDYWFPNDKAVSNNEDVNFWDNFLYPILNWLLSIYLKGFLLAVLLFYIWKIHLKKEIDYEFYSEHLKPRVSNRFEILSFITSVLIWPIILGIDIKKRFSENFRKAEVLTYRANVFTFFSKTELKILETGKHMSFSEFRNYVRSFGMVRRHSFGFALVIVLLLSFIPKPVHAKSISLCSNIYEKIIITNYDYGEVDIGYVHFQSLENEPVTIITFTLKVVTCFFRYIDKILSGFYPDVGVVPRFVNQN